MTTYSQHFERAANQALAAVGNIVSRHAAMVLLENCCDKNGWGLDEQLANGVMGLHFNDPLLNCRTLQITLGQDGATARFTVESAVRMAVNEVTLQLLSFQLQRNEKGFASWQMRVLGRDTVQYALSYMALTLGLNPGIFKMICQSMITETSVFDQMMHKAGFFG